VTRLLFVASRIRPEEKALLGALRARGIDCVRADGRQLVSGPHADGSPVSVALLREISATRALYAAEALQRCGVHVINPAEAVALAADKWRTSLALERDGVPTPAFALALTPEAGFEALERFGYPAVVKPLVSSWGRRVTLIRDRETAEAVMEHCTALPSPQAQIIYIQAFVDKPGRDIRAVVVGDDVLGAVFRHSPGWRTNVAQGAETLPCPLTPEVRDTALSAARAIGAEIAGVDLAEDRDGRLLVLEVNTGVEFAGFERAMGSEVDVAARIADHVAAQISGALVRELAA
jgi:[lysine-biosynthesis-protein LysW]--L-2-aminoadipate ligase